MMTDAPVGIYFAKCIFCIFDDMGRKYDTMLKKFLIFKVIFIINFIQPTPNGEKGIPVDFENLQGFFFKTFYTKYLLCLNKQSIKKNMTIFFFRDLFHTGTKIPL